MPIYKTGDMWSVLEEVDYFLITTCNVVKTNGDLVMGAGIAKQARDKFPGIARAFGNAVKAHSFEGVYGTIFFDDVQLAIFQTKKHWREPSSIILIMYSIKQLKKAAEANPKRQFALNYPGIGKGKLAKEDIKWHLDTLPNNVQIWSYV